MFSLSVSNFVGDSSRLWWGVICYRIQKFLNLHMSIQVGFGESQRPSFKAYFQCHFSTRCFPIPPKMDSLSLSLSVDLLEHSGPCFASDVVPHSSSHPLLNCVPPEWGCPCWPLRLRLHEGRGHSPNAQLSWKDWNWKGERESRRALQASYISRAGDALHRPPRARSWPCVRMCGSCLFGRGDGGETPGHFDVDVFSESSVLMGTAWLWPRGWLCRVISKQLTSKCWGKEGEDLEDEASSGYQENRSAFRAAFCMSKDCDTPPWVKSPRYSGWHFLSSFISWTLSTTLSFEVLQ